ncbi:hypothetical protein QTP81_06860 [Alteromonas sp. ASW11-36]|uniref:Uncharacterized protein n=1 Tax=Alteromonas arenosi TaxID=3055817 RepID=A0ABT7SVW6_9ALTE|nr:hypothetical protein [Alteromonas sp. ASW11-36]MDM7860311.1 hypothetical protein [Alteromonas sp. ASW11-36]
MNKRYFSPSKLSSACVASMLMLAGCGSDVQDQGVISERNQVFTGRAIDGYIARATVFIDSNNNGTRDAWEVWAFTDNQGYFSYNPLTDTDYCTSDASEQQAQYCLTSSTGFSNAVLRIDSGYDTLTGEPFSGQLSRRISTPSEGNVENVIISPITSILTNVESSQRDSVLQSLDINAADIDLDYLATTSGTGIDSQLLNTAIKIHKAVTILSDRLTDIYTEVGNEFDTPNDATAAIYRGLAAEIVQSGSSLNEILASDNALARVIQSAEDEVIALYERKEYALPPESEQQKQTAFNRVIGITDNLASLTDQLIPPTVDTNMETATGSARLVEVLTVKALQERSNNDSTIESMVNFFASADDSLVSVLVDAVSTDLADVSALVQNDFSGSDFDSAEEITQAAQLPDDAEPFSQLSGMTLRVSDLDLGTAPNSVDDSEVEFYFMGDTDAIDGSFSACVKFIDDANASTGELGDGNTRGELVDGFWSLLGSTSDNAESFNLLLTITFLETTYQAILKPAGNATIDNIDYTVARFDLDGEFREFHSTDWLQTTDVIPTNNAECEARLPSRVGL